MNPSRRSLLGACLAMTASPWALAQSAWPGGRPIRIVVPFPAGGQADVAARIVGHALGEALKTSVIVDNKPGGHGFIGGLQVARAQPDGYTLLVGSTGSTAINPKLHENMPYHATRDFSPISLMLTVPIVLMVNPQLPVKTVPELVAYLKRNPGKVNYASAGNGASSHLTGEYFKYVTGTSMTHIPYKGQAPAIADVVAGHAQVMFDTLVSSTPHLRSGKLVALGVTSRTRLAEYPDLPTVAEALNLREFEASSWSAMHAPAGTPKEIVTRLSAEIAALLKTPAIAKRIADLGGVPVGSTPEQLAEFQRSEEEKWGKVIQVAKIKAD
jgi:tripartite-type tricarboxylate transporter receptor subunit TctC